MNFVSTSLNDVILVEPAVFGDDRGFFMETWEQQKFAKAGITAAFVQDNHSRSSHGTLRGLHYQIGQPQGKLVRVSAGEVFDVAVDLRRSSSTFGKWYGVTLSAENKKMLWVPPGFAHGFLVTSKSADFIYKCSDFYAPKEERCIRWDDTDIGVQWPLGMGETPLLSDKDSRGLAFADSEVFS